MGASICMCVLVFVVGLFDMAYLLDCGHTLLPSYVMLCCQPFFFKSFLAISATLSGSSSWMRTSEENKGSVA